MQSYKEVRQNRTTMTGAKRFLQEIRNEDGFVYTIILFHAEKIKRFYGTYKKNTLASALSRAPSAVICPLLKDEASEYSAFI